MGACLLRMEQMVEQMGDPIYILGEDLGHVEAELAKSQCWLLQDIVSFGKKFLLLNSALLIMTPCLVPGYDHPTSLLRHCC